MPRGNEQHFTFSTSSFYSPSVADLTYYALFAQSNDGGGIHSAKDRIPLPFRLVSKLDPYIDASFLDRLAEGTEVLYRKSCLLDLLISSSTASEIIYGKGLYLKARRVSDWSPDLELGPLHFAVLQHSIDGVLQYLEKFRPQDETQCAGYTFSIVECAIGWQPGLVLLSKAGYQVYDALQLTIFRGDLSSLQRCYHSSRVSLIQSWSPRFVWTVSIRFLVRTAEAFLPLFSVKLASSER